MGGWWWLLFAEFGEFGGLGVVLGVEVAELVVDVFDGRPVGVVVEYGEVAQQPLAGGFDAVDCLLGGVDVGVVLFGGGGVGGFDAGEEQFASVVSEHVGVEEGSDGGEDFRFGEVDAGGLSGGAWCFGSGLAEVVGAGSAVGFAAHAVAAVGAGDVGAQFVDASGAGVWVGCAGVGVAAGAFVAGADGLGGVVDRNDGGVCGLG